MFIEKAIKAIGGAQAIDSQPMLTWKGRATVHAADRDVTIRVDTSTNAVGESISRSWLADQEEATASVLQITPRGGKITRNGSTSAAPFAQWDHERIQFSMYQLIRLTPLLQAPNRVVAIDEQRAGLRGLTVKRPGLPPADLWFDDKRALRQIELTVPDAETRAPVREIIVLEGQIEAGGIRWPRSLHISFDAKPYFDLELESFTPRACATVAAEPVVAGSKPKRPKVIAEFECL